jgi:hypothetical protein
MDVMLPDGELVRELCDDCYEYFTTRDAVMLSLFVQSIF